MILDHIGDFEPYRKLSDNFAAGFDYLRATAFEAVADGDYPIVGHDVFARVQSYQTRPREQCRWEAHRHYADIQFIVEGAERMGLAHISAMTVQEPFSRQKDVEFFVDSPNPNHQLVRLNRGDFAIFFPQDVHMPGLMIDRPVPVKKVVIKVRLI